MLDDLPSRLNRLENKIDTLNEAITTLARIDERMVSHMEASRRIGARLDGVEGRIATLELSKEKFTGWLVGVAVTASALSTLFFKLMDLI
jgi:hypothetical protein